MKHILFSFFAFFALTTISGQSSGKLDLSFGDNGILQLNICTWDAASGVAVQPDGKIVAVGYSEENEASEMLIVRILPDGSPDVDFGTDGITVIKISQTTNEATAVALQPDGKILIGGYTRSQGETWSENVALVRLGSDGKPDSTFSGDGIVTASYTSRDRIYAIGVLPDGKIVAAGNAKYGGGPSYFLLCRFLPDGNPDPDFGGTGTGAVVIPIGTVYDVCSSMAIQSDGKIILAGSTVKSNGWPDVALLRFNPDGTLDGTFGTGGKVTTPFGSTADVGLKTVLQPDGKILVSGYSYNTLKKSELAVFRYLPNGLLDTQFGRTGKIRSKIGNIYSSGESMSLRPDGKILVAGCALDSTKGMDFAMKQFNPDGTVDGSFGTNGIVTTNMNDYSDGIADVVFLDDGRIVAGGATFDAVAGSTDMVLAKYLTDLYVGVIDAPQSLMFPWIYPNPVSSAAFSVKYQLRDPSGVIIELYDANGRSLTTLQKGDRGAGEQTEELQLPDDINNGTYLLNIRTGKGNACIKLVIQR